MCVRGYGRSLQWRVRADTRFSCIQPDVTVREERNFIFKAHRVKVLSDSEEVGGAPVQLGLVNDH